MASLTIVPQQTTFDTGEAVSLYCMVEGSPDKWLYYWYKGNTTSQISQLQTRSQKGKNYTVTSAALSDSGEYWCPAQLKLNFSNALTLKVQGKKPPNTALILKPQQTPIFEGDMVTLSCEVDDSPAAGWRFWWFTNSNKSSIPTICKNGSQESKCTIQSVTLSYTAEYWCQAGRGEPPFYLNSSRPMESNLTLLAKSHPYCTCPEKQHHLYHSHEMLDLLEEKPGCLATPWLFVI
uniref:Ig-like domain-containing protein n=1 Tax=Erpetoichthys calabaricus TaxID=27687 RepID=A0A8C4SYG9_ERPCA